MTVGLWPPNFMVFLPHYAVSYSWRAGWSVVGKVSKLLFLRLVLFKNSGGRLCLQETFGNIWWQFWLLQGWGRMCYWHLVGRGQGYCQASYDSQDGPQWMNYLAQNANNTRFRNPVLELFFWVPDLSITLISIQRLCTQVINFIIFLCFSSKEKLGSNWKRKTSVVELFSLFCFWSMSYLHFICWVMVALVLILGLRDPWASLVNPGFLYWTALLFNAGILLEWCRSGYQHWKNTLSWNVLGIGSMSTLTPSLYRTRSEPRHFEMWDMV